MRFRKKQQPDSHNAKEPRVGVASDEDDDQEQKVSVIDALAELQNEIDGFQKEVDICNQERLGSMQIAIGDLGHGLRFVMEQNSGEYLAVFSPSLLIPNRNRLLQTRKQ